MFLFRLSSSDVNTNFLYASLVCSFSAALVTSVGKRWIKRRRSMAEARGRMTAEASEQKATVVKSARALASLQLLPLLLQLSAILFVVALSRDVRIVQRTVARILIAINIAGLTLYFPSTTLSFHPPFSSLPSSPSLLRSAAYLMEGSPLWPTFNQASQVWATFRHHLANFSLKQLPTFGWTTEPKTPTFTLENAAFFIPSIVLPQLAFSHLTPYHLEMIVDKLTACFEADDNGRMQLASAHSDRAVALGAAFLQIFWEKCAFDVEDGFAPARKLLQLLEKDHLVLRCLDPESIRKTVVAGHSDREVLFLLSLTLSSLRPSWVDSPRLVQYQLHTPAPTEALCARTSFYLAQASCKETQDYILESLDRSRARFSSEETRQLHFLAFAMVLGYRLPPVMLLENHE